MISKKNINRCFFFTIVYKRGNIFFRINAKLTQYNALLSQMNATFAKKHVTFANKRVYVQQLTPQIITMKNVQGLYIKRLKLNNIPFL